MPELSENAQGDPVRIFDGHIRMAELLLPPLLEKLREREAPTVVSLFGGSGCGKTGTAAALCLALKRLGISSVMVSGDHYPRRIPLYNDAERLSRFRSAGLSALVREGLYSAELQRSLDALWRQGLDPDPARIPDFPFLAVYQQAGRRALEAYLGTEEEQDFDELNRTLEDFHRRRAMYVRCLGRTEDALRCRRVEPGAEVCILEWTHGGSPLLRGVDIPVYLDSTPESTRLARRLRGRDENTDSAFVTMVLEIEQESIRRSLPRAALLLYGDEVIVR